MTCCGVYGISEVFFDRLEKNANKHFIYLKIFQPFERGGLFEMYFIRKHCKHKEGWFERRETTKSSSNKA